MTKRNETRYEQAFAMIQHGASDEEIRIRLGFSRAVLAAMRKDIIREKGPEF
jgi:hypothetical protein